MRRVVITGLGMLSAAGEGAASLWQSVLDRRSGIGFVHFGGAGEEWKTIAGAIPNFEPEKYVSQKKSLKVMARDIQLAVAGAEIAMEDAGLRDAEGDRERFGVIVGAGVLNHQLDELAYSVQNSLDTNEKIDLRKFGADGIGSLFPLWLLKYLPNMPACHISILFNLQGINNTITTGASGGLQAVGEALRVIQRGAADRMIAGGAESKVNPVGLSEYKILGAFTENFPEEPQKNYRPFSSQAGGFVVGEGSAFVVLEELEHAQKRGAKIYAEIVGFGSSYHGGHEIAMRSALRDAGVDAPSIDYVQASGIGLPEEDRREAQALENVFGAVSHKIWMSASKPITGFTGFASGAMDLAVSTLALREQMAPPMMNFDPKTNIGPMQVPTDCPARQPLRYAMTQAFGFNGQTACLVSKRFEP